MDFLRVSDGKNEEGFFTWERDSTKAKSTLTCLHVSPVFPHAQACQAKDPGVH